MKKTFAIICALAAALIIWSMAASTTVGSNKIMWEKGAEK